MDLHQSSQPPMDRMVVAGIRAVPVLCKLNAKFVSDISVTMQQNETANFLYGVQQAGLWPSSVCFSVCII